MEGLLMDYSGRKAFAAAIDNKKRGLFPISCSCRVPFGNECTCLKFGCSIKTNFSVPFCKLKVEFSCLTSSRMRKLMVMTNGVGRVEAGLVFAEDEEDNGFLLGQDKNKGLRLSSLQEKLQLESGRVSVDGSDISTRLNQLDCVSRSGVCILEEMDEEVLSNRLLVLSRKNKVRSAMELHKSMELVGLQPNAHSWNSFLSCLLRNGRLDEAVRIFKTMETSGITTSHAYSLILKVVADARGCDSALKMFMELQKESKASSMFDIVVYNTVISICGRSNDWMHCKKIWSSMKENGLSGSEVTYSMLVSIFVRCGQNELAIEAYNELVRHGHKVGPDVSQAIIKACAKEGNWDFAMRVFQTMLDDGLQPNLIACNALINSLGKAGKDDLAFKVYNIMRSIGHAPDVYTINALLVLFYRANRPADALLLFDEIVREKGLPQNLHLCHSALMCCSKLGSWERAVQLLWQMEVSGLPVSTASYNLGIDACEIARNPKVALQVYDRMIQKNCIPDTFTHLSLLRCCIWGSLWMEVDEILNAAPNVSLYNAAIQGLCLRGKIENAKKIYKEMCERGFKPDGKTRALMLQKLPNR